MSNRGDWVPVVAGVVLGAGLLLALYQMFFAGRGPKCLNQQVGAPYKCTCKRGSKNDVRAEELERRERAKAEEINNAIAALRARSSGPGFFSRLFPGFGCGGGGGGGWLGLLGGAALLIGLLGILYKNFGSLLNFNFAGGKKKEDPCDGVYEVKKPVTPPPAKDFKPCRCNN